MTLGEQLNEEPQIATYDAVQRNMYVCYVFGGIFAALFLAIFCTAVCCMSTICTATTLVSLASEAFLDFPYLIFYPAAQIFALLCLVVLWSIGAALLASSGEQSTEAVYGTSEWTYTDYQKYMMWYWLFGLLWLGELMVACGFMIVSFCFGIWFFSTEVSTEKNEGGCCSSKAPTRAVPSWVLFKSMKMTYWNHMGTLAFGALIMAVIDMLRIIVEYIEKKKKELGADAGKCWDFIFCCMKCCLYCLDKCMRFLNKNAYIQTMINGTDLCTSACRAVKVMFSNIALFAFMTGIQSGIFFFGKVAISFTTAGIASFIIDFAYKNEVSSIVLPSFVCLLIGYAVSTTFICVYDMGIDTMLMCYSEAQTATIGGEEAHEQLKANIPHELGNVIKKQEEEFNEKNQEKGKAPLEGAEGTEKATGSSTSQ
jgi:hypothetical protein